MAQHAGELRVQVLNEKWPKCKFTWPDYENGKYSGIIFSNKDTETPPTEAELEAAVVAFEKALVDNKYKDDRRWAYPDMGDQLDDLYRKGAFSDEMAAKIKAVKDKYPKS